MTAALLMRVLRDRRRGLVGWATGIIALVAVQVSVYPTIRDSRKGWSELTEQFPEAFRKMFRMEDYTSPTGYLTTELFAFTLPLIFVAIGTTWGSRAAAEEEEKGTADLLLSLPVSRSAVLATRVAGVAVTLVSMATVVVVSLVVGTRATDMAISAGRLALGAASLVLLSSVFAAFAVLVGCATGRRGASLAVSLTSALVMYVLYSLAPLVNGFARLLPVNPFQWSLGTQPLVHGLSAGYSVASVSVTVVLLAVAHRAFLRRDIHS